MQRLTSRHLLALTVPGEGSQKVALSTAMIDDWADEESLVFRNSVFKKTLMKSFVSKNPYVEHVQGSKSLYPHSIFMFYAPMVCIFSWCHCNPEAVNHQ